MRRDVGRLRVFSSARFAYGVTLRRFAYGVTSREGFLLNFSVCFLGKVAASVLQRSAHKIAEETLVHSLVHTWVSREENKYQGLWRWRTAGAPPASQSSVALGFPGSLGATQS
jgi:hypothetical protein